MNIDLCTLRALFPCNWHGIAGVSSSPSSGCGDARVVPPDDVFFEMNERISAPELHGILGQFLIRHSPEDGEDTYFQTDLRQVEDRGPLRPAASFVWMGSKGTIQWIDVMIDSTATMTTTPTSIQTSINFLLRWIQEEDFRTEKVVVVRFR